MALVAYYDFHVISRVSPCIFRMELQLESKYSIRLDWISSSPGECYLV